MTSINRPSTAPKPTNRATVPTVSLKPSITTSMTSPTPMPAARPVATATTISEKKARSEEHTSELQSRGHLVCRLLLEKKKKDTTAQTTTTAVRAYMTADVS